MGNKEWYRADPSILGPYRLCGEKVRELIDGKFEMIPKTKEHIFVNADKCIGAACSICYVTCPGGCYEIEDNKAVWKYGMTHCLECGVCQYVCSVDAIDWAYPEAGTGVILKWS